MYFFFVSGTNTASYDIYCNTSDICKIGCLSIDACALMRLHCFGTYARVILIVMKVLDFQTFLVVSGMFGKQMTRQKCLQMCHPLNQLLHPNCQSAKPSFDPSVLPSNFPTETPSNKPTTATLPTIIATNFPTELPTIISTNNPTNNATNDALYETTQSSSILTRNINNSIVNSTEGTNDSTMDISDDSVESGCNTIESSDSGISDSTIIAVAALSVAGLVLIILSLGTLAYLRAKSKDAHEIELKKLESLNNNFRREY